MCINTKCHFIEGLHPEDIYVQIFMNLYEWVWFLATAKLHRCVYPDESPRVNEDVFYGKTPSPTHTHLYLQLAKSFTICCATPSMLHMFDIHWHVLILSCFATIKICHRFIRILFQILNRKNDFFLVLQKCFI